MKEIPLYYYNNVIGSSTVSDSDYDILIKYRYHIVAEGYVGRIEVINGKSKLSRCTTI